MKNSNLEKFIVTLAHNQKESSGVIFCLVAKQTIDCGMQFMGYNDEGLLAGFDSSVPSIERKPGV